MSRAGHPRKVPKGSLLVKDIGILATLNESLGEIVDAAIYCEGNEIVWVGSTKDLPEKYGDADTVLSMPDRVMAPGLVNTHHHMYQCLTRCCGQVITVLLLIILPDGLKRRRAELCMPSNETGRPGSSELTQTLLLYRTSLSSSGNSAASLAGHTLPCGSPLPCQRYSSDMMHTSLCWFCATSQKRRVRATLILSHAF